ncbi:MAG: efflux RND transporter periplasmic adaptor subunit [Acidobacteriota bacterium]
MSERDTQHDPPDRPPANRPWRLLAAFVLVAAIALGVRAVQDEGDGRWLRVERRDLVVGVPVEGELEAIDSVTIGPPAVPNVWQFKIAWLAEDGSDVRAGQPVVRFDTTEIQRRLQERMASRDSAEKELEKAGADLVLQRRDLELQLAEARARLRKVDFELSVPDDVRERRELEKARIDAGLVRTEISNLENNLEYMDVLERMELGNLRERRDRAASEVDTLQEALAKMTITAPRDGTIVLDSDWQGNKVQVGEQVWRARNVLQIPDLSEMAAEAMVSESEVGRLEPGQAVSFRLDAYPDREYRATVETIGRSVQQKSPTNRQKVVRVDLRVDTTDHERLRPGMRLRGTIEIERRADVVVVPEEALFAGPDGVWVWSRDLLGRRQKIRPELGQRDENGFEVVAGLNPGDRVLAPDAEADG